MTDYVLYVNGFSNIGPGSILFNYKNSFNKFAMKLAEEEARIMAIGGGWI